MLRSRLILLTLSLGLAGLTSCGSLSSREQHSSQSDRGLAAAVASAEQSIGTGLQTEEARRAYETAVEQVVAAWQAAPGPASHDKTITVSCEGRPLRISATWPKGLRFDELIPAVPLEQRKLSRPVTRPGIGAPYVARWRHTDERKKAEPFLSEAGYVAPVTVTLDFRPGAGGRREALLRVHDPRFEETTVVAGRRQPVAADFSAVSEWVVVEAKKQKDLGMSGMDAMRHSEKYLSKLGLISLEPVSRDRIPLIFVHGLMSRPLTWHDAVNELGADPVIRKNYQVYFFRYPTGVPVLYSSSRFREELATLHEELAKRGNHQRAHHMVLIGHSMGGLVSKMQLMSSGDRLWVNVFGATPDKLDFTPEERAALKDFMEFEPNPHVDRVIFVCTPHRGSKMAQGFVGAIGRRLISLPGRALGKTFDILQGEAAQNASIKQLLAKGIPSSIENLSPSSRFMQESIKIPLKPGMHVHSIVGNRDGRPLTDPKCSDGVVPYTSAHLDGVESELVVHSDHGAHATKEAIAEIRRILLLHLRGI